MDNRTRGAVLIFTLWATAVLATVTIAQATRLSLQSRYASKSRDLQESWFLAESAVQAASQVLSEDKNSWDSDKESWAQEPSKPVVLGPGSFLYKVRDEQALLPLNTLSKEFLLRLPGFNEFSVQALLARRAEGKTIVHVGELRTMAGYDVSKLEELVPLVTVYGSGPVNLNTASRPVLETFQLSKSLVDSMESFRVGRDGIAGTGDDGFFERVDLEEISSKLLNSVGYLLTPEDVTLFSTLLQGGAPMLGVASGWFRVTVEGRVARSGVQTKVEAVVDRAGKIGGWNES